MDIFEAIKKRKSIRRYSTEEIPGEIIKKILDAGNLAPSAGNIHPEIFILIRDKEKRKKIASAAKNQDFISKAPVVVVACADIKKSESNYGMRGKTLYCIQDVAAATENMILAATALGIGTCWAGAFDENKISDILELPGHVRPLAIVPMGYPG